MNTFKVDGLTRALTRQLWNACFPNCSKGFLWFLICFLAFPRFCYLNWEFHISPFWGQPGCEVGHLSSWGFPWPGRVFKSPGSMLDQFPPMLVSLWLHSAELQPEPAWGELLPVRNHIPYVQKQNWPQNNSVWSNMLARSSLLAIRSLHVRMLILQLEWSVHQWYSGDDDLASAPFLFPLFSCLGWRPLALSKHFREIWGMRWDICGQWLGKCLGHEWQVFRSHSGRCWRVVGKVVILSRTP